MIVVIMPEEKKIEPVGEKRIWKIMKRDGNRCHYCNVLTEVSNGINIYDHTATIDHVIPKSLCGIDHIHNCVLACNKCNSEKQNNPPLGHDKKKLRNTFQRIKKYLVRI